MKWTSFSADRFGVLSRFQMNELSPGLTVVWGPNDCGKTTLKQMIRGAVYGYSTSTAPMIEGEVEYDGTVRYRIASGEQMIRRERGSSTDRLYINARSEGIRSTADQDFPGWVGATEFREICCVGEEDADRSSRLTELCLAESHPDRETLRELEEAEQTLADLLPELEGTHTRLSLSQRIDELAARLRRLQDDYEALRPADPDEVARLETLRGTQTRLQTESADAESRLSRLDERIRRLDDELAETAEPNRIALERAELEARRAVVRRRLDHWESVRRSILQDQPQAAKTGYPQSLDGVVSTQALMRRIEERITDLRRGGEAGSTGFRETVATLESEVFALCDYLEHHHDGVQRAVRLSEQACVAGMLQSVDEMTNLLRGQEASLSAELERAENIIERDAWERIAHDCDYLPHRSADRTSMIRQGRSRAVIEADLVAARDERRQLMAHLESLRDEIRALQLRIDELRRSIDAAAGFSEIEEARMRVRETEAEYQALVARRGELANSRDRLLARIEELRSRRTSAVLPLASRYLSRVTDGEYHRIAADESAGKLLISSRRQERPMTLVQLSRGTRDLVGLVLRVALLQVKAKEGAGFPLFLDDVFVTADNDRASALADFLVEVAADGQQIILLTCQNDVRDLFRGKRADLRTFGNRLAEPVPPAPEPPAPEPAPKDSDSLVFKAFSGIAEECPGEIKERVVASSADPNWLFYLESDHLVDDLASVTTPETEAFRAAGISTIHDLLSASVGQLNERLRNSGRAMAIERIEALRGQAEMASRIPMLRQSDAELLIAAGIRTVDQLRTLRPELVFVRVLEFQKSDAGARYRRSGRYTDQQQAINWTRWALHSRTLATALDRRSRFSIRDSSSGRISSAGGDRKAEYGDARESRRSVRSRSTNRESRVRVRERLASDDERRQSRARRLARKRRMQSRRRSERSFVVSRTDGGKQREWRYYLNLDSPVEQAPSIGPKTADYLETVEITTVRDLLHTDSALIADRLDRRRITAKVVEQWQQQATLVCRIPELRGHDAQILVACDFTDPDQLRDINPEELLSRISPFIHSKEGERIIRGGKMPDLGEVTDWIRYAAGSRELRAA